MVFSITTSDGRIINVRADSLAEVRLLFPDARSVVENTGFRAERAANIPAIGALLARESTAALAGDLVVNGPVGPDTSGPQPIAPAGVTTATGIQPPAVLTGTNVSDETQTFVDLMAGLAAQGFDTSNVTNLTPPAAGGSSTGGSTTNPLAGTGVTVRQPVPFAGETSNRQDLTEEQLQQGIFQNFAQSQGLNPTGIGSRANAFRFAPAVAAQIVGQSLADSGLRSGLDPSVVGGDFTNFLGQTGIGGIGRAAEGVLNALRGQFNPTSENQFLNPNVLTAGGGFTQDASFILDLARQAGRNRIGGLASTFGTPDSARLAQQFAANPQANFADFAARALGAG